MKQRLLDSGRFVEANIKPLEQEHTPNPQRLKIEVKELPKATPLNEPLLPEEEILMKFGKWFGDIDRWQGDLVAPTEGSLGTSMIVVSPRRGVLATARVKALARSGNRPDYAFVATQDETAIFSVPRGAKWLPQTCNPSTNWLPTLE